MRKGIFVIVLLLAARFAFGQSVIDTMQVDQRYVLDYRKIANDYSSLEEDFYQSSFFEDRFKCFVFYQGKSSAGRVILVLSPVDHPEFEIAAELPVIEKLFQQGLLWVELESAYLAKSD